jgi:hypothetical protein
VPEKVEWERFAALWTRTEFLKILVGFEDPRRRWKAGCKERKGPGTKDLDKAAGRASKITPRLSGASDG